MASKHKVISGWHYEEDSLNMLIYKTEPIKQNMNADAAITSPNGKFKFTCEYQDADKISPHQSKEKDSIIVKGDNIDGELVFSRTRYRACCEPLFVEVDGYTFLLVNTDLRKMSVYLLPSGKEISVLRAPEMMVSIEKGHIEREGEEFDEDHEFDDTYSDFPTYFANYCRASDTVKEKENYLCFYGWEWHPAVEVFQHPINEYLTIWIKKQDTKQEEVELEEQDTDKEEITAEQ
jgi:hypothetical protein